MTDYKDMSFDEIREVANNHNKVALKNDYLLEYLPNWATSLDAIHNQSFNDLKQLFLTNDFNKEDAKRFDYMYNDKQDLLDTSEYCYKLFKVDKHGDQTMIKTWY